MHGSRIDFGDGDAGFLNGPEYDCHHTDWYKLFAETKAEIFLADRLLSQMGPHQLRDFLITCRNSLKIGGRLRIGESDWNHGSAAYRAQASESAPLQKFDIQSITKLLSSVGLTTMPVEFHDKQGILHELEPSFEKYGNVQGSSRLGPHLQDRTHQSSSLIIDGVKTSDDRGGMNGFEEKIFAVGDSHIRFLSGHDEVVADWPVGQHAIRFEGYSSKFIGLHLGPGLAFNLNTANTRNNSREKLEGLISTGVLPKGCKVMFSFGEIDCRFHVCRHADRQVQGIEDVVDGITAEYAVFLDWVQAQGFSASVWGIPSVTWIGETLDAKNPIYGSYEQRHMAAARFNARMKEICQIRKMPFLSVLETARDASGMARKELFFDVLHLSQRARPLLHSLMPSGILPL
jgi:predicted SAM-dependent methyltransferase